MSEPKSKLTKKQLDLLMSQLSPKSPQESNVTAPKKGDGIFSRFLKFLSKSVKYIDRIINFIVKPKDSERNDVVQYARSPILFGVYVILIFFGVGVTWAAFAPLDSAAGATGVLVTDSQKQLIQHKLGGYLTEIYVKVGDQVKKGQPLLRLETSEAASKFVFAEISYRNLLASKARLIAEKNGDKNIDFPAELMAVKNETEISQLLGNQEKLFHSKNDAIDSRITSIRNQIEITVKNIDTLESTQVADKKTLEYTRLRLESLQKLFDKGFANKSQIGEAEVNYERYKSQLLRTKNNILEKQQELEKLESDIKMWKSDHLSRVMQELKDVSEKIITTKEELSLFADAIKKEIIRSPVDGTVNVINVNTIGAYIQPHQQLGAPNPGHSSALMEITPDNDKLVIDARIPAGKIASVHVGLKAKIRFSAYKSRTSPTFTGTVVSMSSDAIEDQKSLQLLQMKGLQDDSSFYSAKIEIDMEEFNSIAKKRGLELKPGMRAEITIITGKRTLLRYLLDPVTDNMFRAFNEK